MRVTEHRAAAEGCLGGSFWGGHAPLLQTLANSKRVELCDSVTRVNPRCDGAPLYRGHARALTRGDTGRERPPHEDRALSAPWVLTVPLNPQLSAIREFEQRNLLDDSQ